MTNPLTTIIRWLLDEDFVRCESEEEKLILYRTAEKVGRERVR